MKHATLDLMDLQGKEIEVPHSKSQPLCQIAHKRTRKVVRDCAYGQKSLNRIVVEAYMQGMTDAALIMPD